MDVLGIVGAVTGALSAIGVPIAYLQLRAERAAKRDGGRDAAAADGSVSAVFGDSTLFAPTARYRGFDVGLVDRRQESAALVRQIRSGRSVVAIEGIAGVGKTALAAHLCSEVGRSWKVRWVFCEEKGALFTLTALARALVSGRDSKSARRLRSVLTRGTNTSDTVDAVIDLLDGERLLLVFDNFHVVTDSGLHALVTRLEHSRTASSVVLTSRARMRELHAVPLVGKLVLGGLPVEDAWVLLRDRSVPLSKDTARVVWQRAGDGNPLALTLFAGRARETDPEELAVHLPGSADDLDQWIALAFEGLGADAKSTAKMIAFAYEPTPRDVLAAIAAPLDPTQALADLSARFVVTENSGRFEMHSAVRDYVSGRTTDRELADLATQFTEYYQRYARTVFLEGLGPDEPSYGTLYLESFPDYFSAVDRHIRFVDDLLDRLTENGYGLERGARVLVLGSGDGTHDPGFAKHGLRVRNVDIQPEIAELGRSKAAALPAVITYVVADMTQPLPHDLAGGSMDAVFNIGSSFGYESSDETNAMVFHNAAKVLRDGAPFVFEYVNGPHWENMRVQRQVDVTTLPNGSTRTEVSVTNPEARTSLMLIGLQRPDGTGGWFRHFMRYYRLGEVRAMMADAGLQPVATYGAKGGRVTGEPFDERRSEAMVIIATRATSQVGGLARPPAEPPNNEDD